MKVLLTGATGLVGGEVLTQLLAHPKVTWVVALTRRPLPDAVAKHTKLQTVVHQDFSSWPSSTVDQLSDVDACIWALGVAIADMETQRKVNLEYTLAAAEAFAKGIAPKTQERSGKKFHFVYTSGIMAERDQQRNLWVAGHARKLRVNPRTTLSSWEALGMGDL